MIFVGPASSSLSTAAYFATKRTDISVLKLNEIPEEGDFCVCLHQCAPCLKVFTDEIGTNNDKNDKYLEYMNVGTSGSLSFTLTNVVTGDEIDVTDNTYGTLYDGQSEDIPHAAYELDFYKIWNEEGYGTYQLTIEYIIAVSGGGSRAGKTSTSPCFKIEKFSERAANRTIRIETRQGGNLKHGRNYGSTSWTQQIRLPGRLIYSGDVQENDSVQMNDNERSLIQIKDQTFPEYTLEIYLVTSQQIAKTLFDYLFSGEVRVSDYNLFNFVVDPNNLEATAYRYIPLKRINTDFTPNARAIRKTFSLTMEYANKNVFKTND